MTNHRPGLKTRPYRVSVCGPAGERGFTFIELLVVTTLLVILASAVMPLTKVTVTLYGPPVTPHRPPSGAARGIRSRRCLRDLR